MDMTAERAEKLPRPSTEAPAKTEEPRPHSPLRRRLLRASVGVLALELLGVGTLKAKEEFDKFFTRPTTSTGEIPKPPVIEPDKPASEKAINKVPLAELTKKTGIISVVPFGGQMSAENPYGFSLAIGNLTIVQVEKNPTDRSAWVAVTTAGERLEKKETGKLITNFDGSQIKELDFKGLTAWILVDDNIFVQVIGSDRFSRGMNSLEKSLIVGSPISFDIGINQLDKKFQEMNLKSYQIMSESAGKSNLDRSDQTFKFRATFANINP